MLTSFCMRASGTIPSSGVGRSLSRLLLSVGHGSTDTFSSVVKPSKAVSKVLPLQPLLLTCPAALFCGFVTALWVCAENWVTEKDPGQSRKTTKKYLFWAFFLTQTISVMLHSGRDGEGRRGCCSLSSSSEPEDEPREGSLMLSWAGQNRDLTPSSLECAGLSHYTLTGEI